MNRRPRKMVPVVRNVKTMYEPVKSEKMSPAEQVEVLIEEVESEIYSILGDKPLLTVLVSPEVIRLKKRLDKLKQKKENIARAKKLRKRHQGAKIREEVME